jgi:hypothetical protein
MKLTSFFASLLILASIAFAQEASERAFPKRPFNHDAKFVTEYEAEENTTHVFLEPVFIDSTSLRLAADFQYVGKSPVKPKHISLAFYTLYPDCKFPSRPMLTMLVDGELVKFGFTFKSFRERKSDEEGVAFSFSEMEGDKCNEILAMFISQKNFLRLVNARHVEVQVDAFKFKLTEANLEALRDLASRMAK